MTDLLSAYTTPVKKPERAIVGREKEIRTILAALERPELCNVILLAEAGSGKLLPLDTPLPTPSGMTTMGQCQVGDQIIGGGGSVFNITFKSDIDTEPELYQFVFDDGATQDACVDHQWLVLDDGQVRVMTTRALLDEGILTEGGQPRFSVPLAGIAQYQGEYALNVAFIEGYSTAMRGYSDESIPDEIKYANAGAREFYLAGLIDTYESHAGMSAPVGFNEPGWLAMPSAITCTHERFARDLYQMLWSMGIKARVERAGAFHTASVSEHSEHAGGVGADEGNWIVYYHMSNRDPRQIVMIRPVPSRPGACIQVDSPDRTYLCGASHLVTHNTALVQGTVEVDTKREYREVDLSRMIADTTDANELAAKLKALFDEVERRIKHEGRDIVLFIDEFHQVVQMSSAAVEALKPLLADSGTRGIRVVAATTFEEFRQHISPNQPLVERLQRINLNPPGEDMVVRILEGMAERYGVLGEIEDPKALFKLIFEYTNRYVPASSQPRKSLLILDAMIGWHRLTGQALDAKLLARVIEDSQGVTINLSVDGTSIKRRLDAAVLAQDFATSAIEQRLQICVADLNDKNRPQSVMLLTGSSGVGKSCTSSTCIPYMDRYGNWGVKPAGEIKVGDWVFDRLGDFTEVLGVFPQGKRDVYRVTFEDGRYLDVSDNHLFAVVPMKRARNEGYTIYSVQTLLNKGLVTRGRDGRETMKYYVPAAGAVRWPERKYKLDPYALGVLIADGCLHSTGSDGLEVSSMDDEIMHKAAALIDGCKGAIRRNPDKSYSWTFYTQLPEGKKNGVVIRRSEVLSECLELNNIYSRDRFIPEAYKYGSIEQRWALIQGLFDCDGHIGSKDGDRYNVSFSSKSERLVNDIQDVLFSLGVSSTIGRYVHKGHDDGDFEYILRVKSANDEKHRFFTLTRKLEIAQRAKGVNRQRVKRFDWLGIRSIEKLDYQEDMVCFYVDNDEHLFQAGQNIVTHNTEVTKQLAKILFDDPRSLVRFDMSEFALDDSVERFRAALSQRVWERPYSIVLLDEIEKAAPSVTRMLLAVLDDARVTDVNGREVSLKNCYIVMTTNAGSEIYKNIGHYLDDSVDSKQVMRRYEALIRSSITQTTGQNRFPVELLGRINVIAPFRPLSRETLKKIVRNKLVDLKRNVAQRHNVHCRIDSAVIEYIVEDNLSADSDAGGARRAISKLESEVTQEVARFINHHKDIREIIVKIDGIMASSDKRLLESDARVKVYAANH